MKEKCVQIDHFATELKTEKQLNYFFFKFMVDLVIESSISTIFVKVFFFFFFVCKKFKLIYFIFKNRARHVNRFNFFVNVSISTEIAN